MEKNDFIEQIIGGIFAIIAVGAAIAELVINGISSATIASCIKDVFGTLAIVILFFAVMRDIIPGFRFKKILLSAIENWEKENSNMIVRKPEHDDGEKGKKYYSLDMKTDVSDFYDNGSHNKTGLFVRIPVLDKSNYKNAFEITFSMNKGTFFGDVREELNDSNYREVAKRFEDFINAKYRDTVSASYKTAKTISVQFKKGLHKKSDIENMIDVINSMYSAYLVSARIKQ